MELSGRREIYLDYDLCKIYSLDKHKLEHVKSLFKKKEIYEKATLINGLFLEYIPDKLKTHKLCRIAVIQNGLALKYVPYRLKMKEICLKAIENDEESDNLFS